MTQLAKPRDYFPLGKADGSAFCNRLDETSSLLGNIHNTKHTFLAAPRRYGKSSLCERVLKKTHLPSVTIDLYIATTEKGIERTILKGILKLIGQITGRIDQTLQKIKYSFKNLKPKLNFDSGHFHLEIDVITQATVPEVIQEALLFLDILLQSKNKQAVILFDEFQRIIEIAPNMGIEAGIRAAAQELKHLALIFSGSNRHLIESIFQDAGRPLYKLCKKIKLDRIKPEHYKSHLNKAAKQMWSCHLNDSVFEIIMQLTDQHPYYINYLCDYLWADHDKPPTVTEVKTRWSQIIEEERSDLLREYFSISENQKKIMRFIATHSTSNLYTTDAANIMGIPTTSISHALNGLLNKDLVERDNNKEYKVINPCFRALFADKLT